MEQDDMILYIPSSSEEDSVSTTYEWDKDEEFEVNSIDYEGDPRRKKSGGHNAIVDSPSTSREEAKTVESTAIKEPSMNENHPPPEWCQSLEGRLKDVLLSEPLSHLEAALESLEETDAALERELSEVIALFQDASQQCRRLRTAMSGLECASSPEMEAGVDALPTELAQNSPPRTALANSPYSDFYDISQNF